MMHVFSTLFGPVGIDWSERGITKIRLLDAPLRSSRAKPPRFVIVAARALERHLSGSSQDLGAIELDMEGLPPFHRRAYEAARAIEAGQTASYGELAVKLGKGKGAARAVGQAMAQNPFLVVVPCHRVLAGASKLGGFSAPGGAATKAKMLSMEGAKLGERVTPLPFDAEAATRHLREGDPVLAPLIDRVGPYRIRLEAAPSVFDALGRSIVYQQLSGKAAATIHARYRMLFPEGRPTAEGLRALDDRALRGAGLSENKAKALRDLGARVLSGELPDMKALRKLGDEEVIATLTRVRGIGRWTVQMLLMFRLGRPDVLPVDDYGVRKGFQKVYHTRDLPTAERLEKHAKIWAPYRSVGSWYMWRALE